MHIGFWNYLYLKSHNLQLAPHLIKWSRISYSYGYYLVITERHSRPRDSHMPGVEDSFKSGLQACAG
ncbi:hypothetical protein K469DRAFT_712367 [Zopfia rhizophila CBS 207.26]|uniref:Uncharacterized protein n=1 Tax=Zopfia rhizophila CBS 207.26 TaxID=1314779 RepID=A0A6A6ERH6_9PEZI|nr:hypothetical protein K469DRAFT_712367 [Zopfia rhizophila CBS 207.26]